MNYNKEELTSLVENLPRKQGEFFLFEIIELYKNGCLSPVEKVKIINSFVTTPNLE